MTLTEVLVSVLIFFVFIPALLGAMLFTYGLLTANAHRVAALNLARKKMEQVMNIQYASIATGSTAYTENNVCLDSTGKLKAKITVTVTNPAGTTRKLIAVTVSWTEQKRTLAVTLNTLVSRNNVS